jgi:hypothetical protein
MSTLAPLCLPLRRTSYRHLMALLRYILKLTGSNIWMLGNNSL